MSARNEPPRAAQLGAILGRLFPETTPYRVALAVQVMTAAAKAHKSVGVARCNYGQTEAQEARQDKRLGRLEADAAQALAVCGEPSKAVSLSFGGDPRGYCGSLHVEGEPGDGWGGGYPIYE